MIHRFISKPSSNANKPLVTPDFITPSQLKPNGKLISDKKIHKLNAVLKNAKDQIIPVELLKKLGINISYPILVVNNEFFVIDNNTFLFRISTCIPANK